jgi:Domain of unknown function (DUF305)
MPARPLPNGRAQSLAAGGIGALTAVAVATAVLAFELPTGPEHLTASSHHDHGARSSRTNGWDGVPTFYSEVTQANARMHEDMEIAASGDVDRDFIRMMMPHHQGAIAMALALLKYGHDEKLKRLAQSIIIEQGQEIAYMRTLLDWPANPPDAASITDR